MTNEEKRQFINDCIEKAGSMTGLSKLLCINSKRIHRAVHNYECSDEKLHELYLDCKEITDFHVERKKGAAGSYVEKYKDRMSLIHKFLDRPWSEIAPWDKGVVDSWKEYADDYNVRACG